MMDFEDLDDIFGKMDQSDQSQDESEEEFGDKNMKKGKKREDEAEEVNDSDNGEEKENAKASKKPKAKRIVKNPQPKLDADRICGPRGIPALLSTFKGVKLQGKGHEKSDLDLVLKKMEHWAHRLFPQLPFADCLEKVERLGAKKGVQTYMKKVRMDLIESSVQDEVTLSDDENHSRASHADAFDELLAHYSKPSSTPSGLTAEQQAKIAENRRKAEERRKSRLMESMNATPTESCGNSQGPDATPTPASEDLVDIDSLMDMPDDED